jgi:hypothetical protein
MKFRSSALTSAAIVISAALSACGPQQEATKAAAAPAPASDAAPAEGAAATAEAAKAAPAAEAAVQEPAAASDFGDFGSDEALPRKDAPTRGVLTFEPKDGVFTPMDHWEQYDWVLKASRCGHYKVRLSYELDHATLGVQLKFGETRLRKVVQASQAGHTVTLGELFVPPAEDPQSVSFPLSIYAPQSSNSAGFGIKSLSLVPTAEGSPVIAPEGDGSFVLTAKAATTWSETMRYEPKPEKNCLGFWTNPDDMAEWELEVAKPGKYEVLVTQGCDGGNAGSEVMVRLAGQEAKFTVQDTGGFQKWQEVKVGVMEVTTVGTHYLQLDPLTKAKAGIMDVQRVVLRPI